MKSIVLSVSYFLGVFVIEKFLLKSKIYKKIFIICSMIFSLLLAYVCIYYSNSDNYEYLEFIFVMIPLLFIDKLFEDK